MQHSMDTNIKIVIYNIVLVGQLQLLVRQSHDLVGHLILSNIFVVGQNVLRVLGLVGQYSILVGHLSLTYRYFKA